MLYGYMINAISVILLIHSFKSAEKTTAIRLKGSFSASSGVGRVLVFHDGNWRAICAESWDLDNARVVCRQLGYKSVVRTFWERHVFRGSGRIRLNGLNCTGNETSVANCLHGGMGNQSCRQKADAGVECSSTGMNFYSQF